MFKLRQAIAAVIINDKNEILLCQRSDLPEWWQFPQGGIEPGESPMQAMRRELSEELGNNKVEVLKAADRTTIYYFKEPGPKHSGQEMHWFLVRFRIGEEPHLEDSDGCFLSTRWEPVETVLPHIPEFKREAFREGLKILGLQIP